MPKRKDIGFLILDEDRPLRITGDSYVNFGARWPIAIFADMTIACRVKRMVQQQHRAVANGLNPEVGPDQKRCHKLWIDRANGLRIQRIEYCAPTVADVKAMREVQR